MTDAFRKRLEVFNNEQANLQHFFFTSLAVRRCAIDIPDVVGLMNDSLYWRVTHQGTIVSTFIAMGRIFDDKSKHNIGRIRRVIENTPEIFSIECLKQRKAAQGVYADEYVKDRHALDPSRADAMLFGIDYFQGIYDARYKAIRHSFAHKRLGTVDQINALLAKTDIEEMKRMCSFLDALWRALDQLHRNGLDPVMRPRTFVLAPARLPQGSTPGEEAYRDARAAILTAVGYDHASDDV